MNRNYNLSLTAIATTTTGETFDLTFDPYTDCTDMDSLLEYAADNIPGDFDEQDAVQTVKITDFAEVPEKWANKDDVWEFAAAFAECEQEIEVVEAAFECDVKPADIDEAYQGEYSSDEDFAREIADQLGAVDKNASWPMNCIDWEFAAKELMYDYSEHNGHYFRWCGIEVIWYCQNF